MRIVANFILNFGFRLFVYTVRVEYRLTTATVRPELITGYEKEPSLDSKYYLDPILRGPTNIPHIQCVLLIRTLFLN
jgi:hypothetical protein